jgi:arginine:ornithine antiporter/lysine permease
VSTVAKPTGTLPSPSAPLTAARPGTAEGGKLGVGLLVALVVGSILGSGIFGLPQNMAVGAGAGAIVIGWAITGVGMLMLAFTYQMLAVRRPELDNGVYAYARALAGEYVGFNAAWGYWVSAWIGNVGYLVAAFGALGLLPGLRRGQHPDGDRRRVGGGVGCALHGAARHPGRCRAQRRGHAAKVIPLLVFIVLVAMAFQVSTFKLNYWGDPQLGSLLDQVRSTMLVTVWVFIGIEGASVYSARAARREDVGRATVIGFVVCLALLMGVSLLSLGIFTQPELAALKNPSMAPVLEKAVGTWGAVLIYLGLIISVGGGFLAWTLLAAESLFTPAGGGVMPAWLARQNGKGVPAHALWLTNGMVQVFLILTLVSKASYLALISLSTAMILIPYLFSALYGLKLARQGRAVDPAAAGENHPRRDISITALAAVYCTWLLYAAGLKYLLLSALLYAPGAAIYLVAKKQRAERAFTGRELVILAVLLLVAVASATLLWSGRLSL